MIKQFMMMKKIDSFSLFVYITLYAFFDEGRYFIFEIFFVHYIVHRQLFQERYYNLSLLEMRVERIPTMERPRVNCTASISPVKKKQTTLDGPTSHAANSALGAGGGGRSEDGRVVGTRHRRVVYVLGDEIRRR